jgi:hypothetical protein
MGFGSYDESEQDNQEMDTNFDEESQESLRDKDHDGNLDFEMEDTESAIDRLKAIQEEEEEEE